jgi:hypothetical protein
MSLAHRRAMLKAWLRQQRTSRLADVEEYIKEAEQGGPSFWDQFESGEDAVTDFDIWLLNREDPEAEDE